MSASSLRAWLFGATFAVAIAGLVYELIAGTVASYLLGDSVTQFSLVIGVFMSSMGVGAFLTRFAAKPSDTFISIQILLSVIGGFSAPIFFFAFPILSPFLPFLLGIVAAIGILSGMEIPILVDILKRLSPETKDDLSGVLTADYIGALVAALIFPLFIIPMLGLLTASIAFGLLNWIIAFLAWRLLKNDLTRNHGMVLSAAGIALAFALISAQRMEDWFNTRLYDDPIIFAETTSYQSIKITQDGVQTRLYLNDAIQFDSLDEYRYHETLVHPAMSHAPHIETVLILGGGDGMALREVLKYQDVKKVDLVDLDARVVELFSNAPFDQLNAASFSDYRVATHAKDAWLFLKERAHSYDVIIADLPDPANYALGKLYSVAFYHDIKHALSAAGIFVTQASSAFFAPDAFWCIDETLREAGMRSLPYHDYVPSFGDWGFILGAKHHIRQHRDIPSDLRHYKSSAWSRLQEFPMDMRKRPTQANTLSTQILTQYYQQGWSKWFD